MNNYLTVINLLRCQLYAVMGCLETLSRLETVSRQCFYRLGLGLGLEGYCLGLGVEGHCPGPEDYCLILCLGCYSTGHITVDSNRLSS